VSPFSSTVGSRSYYVIQKSVVCRRWGVRNVELHDVAVVLDVEGGGDCMSE